MAAGNHKLLPHTEKKKCKGLRPENKDLAKLYQLCRKKKMDVTDLPHAEWVILSKCVSRQEQHRKSHTKICKKTQNLLRVWFSIITIISCSCNWFSCSSKTFLSSGDCHFKDDMISSLGNDEQLWVSSAVTCATALYFISSDGSITSKTSCVVKEISYI